MEKILSWLFGLALLSCILATVVANLNIGDESADCVGCEQTKYTTVRDSTTNIGYIGKGVIAEPEKIILGYHIYDCFKVLNDTLIHASFNESVESVVLFNSNYLSINNREIKFVECEYAYYIDEEIWAYYNTATNMYYQCARVTRNLATRDIKVRISDVDTVNREKPINKTHTYK